MDEEARDVDFDPDLGLELMTRGPDLTRTKVFQAAEDLSRDSPYPDDDEEV